MSFPQVARKHSTIKDMTSSTKEIVIDAVIENSQDGGDKNHQIISISSHSIHVGSEESGGEQDEQKEEKEQNELDLLLLLQEFADKDK